MLSLFMLVSLILPSMLAYTAVWRFCDYFLSKVDGFCVPAGAAPCCALIGPLASWLALWTNDRADSLPALPGT